MTIEEAIAKLKALSAPEKEKASWSGYRELGFEMNDLELLLDLIAPYYLNSEQSDEESAVSIHAWRAMAAIGDVLLVPELVELSMECELIGDDWLSDEFTELMSHFGMEAMSPLIEAARDRPASNLAMDSCEAIVQLVRGEEDRKEAVTALAKLLDEEQFDRDFRGMVVMALLDLEGVEEIDRIRMLYQDNRVNILMAGDLEEVELELGLRDSRSTPRPDLVIEEARLVAEEKKAMAGPYPADGGLEEKLQYYLIRYGLPESIKAVDELDGYLLAIVLSGLKVTADQLFNLVWSPPSRGYQLEFGCDFASQQEEAELRTGLMELLKRIKRGMAEGTYEPHLSIWPDAAESMDPEVAFFTPWLHGYLVGEMTMAAAKLDENYDGNSAITFLAVEMMRCEDEGRRLLEDSEENTFDAFMELAQKKFVRSQEWVLEDFDLGGGAFDMNSGFQDYSQPVPQAKKEEKIERNSPCPCGSGRKYKKCCMN